MYNVGHQIKFKGPNEYFTHGPLSAVYVIQISSQIVLGSHQMIRRDAFNLFIYLI